MNRNISLLLVMILMVACSKVPLTGRKQTTWMSSGEMQSMSYTNYKTVLNEAKKLPDSDPRVQQVKKVGAKIKLAVEAFMKQIKQEKLVEGFAWEFNVIDDPNMVNAWCMPGGKVAFYTRIIPICEDDLGVAVVMGHEVAHAIAKHGNERMTHSLMQQMGGMALSVALTEKPEATKNLFMSAYGLGSNVGVMLPFSRTHESEADRLGLIFMAMAGYNPEAAPKFWGRMAKLSGGSQPPEFLSTHPAHENRIKDLNANMVEAKKYFKP
jgi:predicted Zn-dependent protease